MYELIKDASTTQKIEIVKPFYVSIFETIKRDIKQDHLANDKVFFHKKFEGKTLARLKIEDMINVYVPLAVKDEQIAEFIIHRWLYKNPEVYELFSEELAKINPEFENIKEIDDQVSTEIIEKSISQFGAIKTFLFSVFNSVVFSAAAFEKLEQLAVLEIQEKK